MKRLVLFTLLALAVPAAASADTITTGNLSFNCVPACTGADVFGDAFIPPTAGSFVYDDTTQQFLNVMVNWDGFQLAMAFHSPETTFGDPLVFQELTGGSSTPPFWFGLCTKGTIFPPGGCGGEFGFQIYDGHNLAAITLGPLLPFTSEFTNAGGSGTVVATDLATSIATPEPTAAVLLLLGSGLAFALRMRCASGRERV